MKSLRDLQALLLQNQIWLHNGILERFLEGHEQAIRGPKTPPRCSYDKGSNAYKAWTLGFKLRLELKSLKDSNTTKR